MKFTLFVLFLFLSFVVADEAYFIFKYGYSYGEFTIKLTDDKKIQHARDILSGKTDDELHIMGRIKKNKVDYNSKWDFYLNPETITFFNQAIEVCDASIEYTNDHIDEACGAFLPGCYWCPWESKLVREVKNNDKSFYYQNTIKIK